MQTRFSILAVVGLFSVLQLPFGTAVGPKNILPPVASSWTAEPVTSNSYTQWSAIRGWNKLVYETSPGAVLILGANNNCENLFTNALYPYNPVANPYSRRTWSGSREINGVEGL